MKHRTKQALSWLLSLALMLSLIPNMALTAYAASSSGTIGTAAYTISDGVLTVGSGEFTIENWASVFGAGGTSNTPNATATNIKSVSFASGARLTSDTSKYMFCGWTALKSVDLTNLTASNVTHIGFMFMSSNKLTSVTFGSGFDTSKVNNMRQMFSGCSSLAVLDLGTFKSYTGNGTRNLYQMFYNCSNLETIRVSDDWNVENAYGDGTFSGCSKLEGGNGTKANGSGDYSYAVIDGKDNKQGYFTSASAPVEHRHDFSYSASGSTLTATCSASDCGLTDNKVELTLTPPAKTVYGDSNSAAATLEGGEAFNAATGLNIGSSQYYVYYKKGSDNQLGAAPTTPGEYTVKVTISNVAGSSYTLTAGYTIAQKEIGLTWADTTFHYDGKSHVPTATATGLVGSDECDVTVTGEQTAIGTYTATASGLSNEWYKLPENTTTEFAIEGWVGTARYTIEEAPSPKPMLFSTRSIPHDIDGSVLTIYGGEFNNADWKTAFANDDFIQNTRDTITSVRFVKENDEDTAAKLTDSAQGMFQNWAGLKTIDFTNLDTSSVTWMGTMFAECSSLTELDLSPLDTKKVTNMSNMFYKCSKLEKITVGANWQTASSTSHMFSGCNELAGNAGTTYTALFGNYISTGDGEEFLPDVNGRYAHVDKGTIDPGFFYNAHEHHLTYTVDQNKPWTITATCDVDGCYLGDSNNHSVSISLVKPTLYVYYMDELNKKDGEYDKGASPYATLTMQNVGDQTLQDSTAVADPDGKISGISISVQTFTDANTAAPTFQELTGATIGEIEYYEKGSDTKLDKAPTDAGTYTAKVKIGDATASVDYRIFKRFHSPVLKSPVKNASYDFTSNTEQDLITVEEGAIKKVDTTDTSHFEYALGTNATTIPTDGWSTEIPKGSGAGPFYVFYRVVGDRNHGNALEAEFPSKTGYAIPDPNDEQQAQWESATYKPAYSVLVISPDFDIPPTAKVLTYNGNEQELVNKGTAANNGTMQYAIGQDADTAPTGGWGTEVPKGTNAGDYYVWYKTTGTAVCVPVTIKQKYLESWPAEPTNLTATYGQTLADVTLENPEGGTPGTWAWVDSTTSVGNVGDNAFKATFTPTDTNYKPVENRFLTVTVSKASLTGVSVQGVTLTYTGETQTPQVTTAATAVNNQPVTFTYSKTQGGEYGEMPTVTNVSDGGTFYYKASAPNHEDATGSFTVMVNKAEVTAPTIASKEYTGSTLTADVAANDRYTVTTNLGGTNVGDYNVVLTLADPTNYKWTDSAEAAKTLTFQITKATAPAVTVPTPEAVTYDPTKTLANVELTGGWAWVTNTTVPTVGNSSYDAALTVDDANYDYTGVDGYNSTDHKVTRTVALTVNKASNPLTYTATQTVTMTFSTSSQTETLAAATSAEGALTYEITSQKNSSNSDVSHFSLDGTTLTLAANTPAGIYTVVVTATATGNDNYDSGTKNSTVTVTVNKTDYTGTKTASAILHAFSGRTVEVTLPELPAGASYGSVTNNNSALFTVGTVESGKVTVTAAKDFDKSTEADDKTFTVSVTGADNYNNYSVTVTITPTFYVALTEDNKPTISVSGGHNPPRVDDVLTANTTATDLTYQWYRGDVAIADATSATYTAVAADVGKTIKVTVTQTKKEDGTDYVEGVTKPVQTSAPTTEVAKKQRSGLTITNGSLGYTYGSGEVLTITASADNFASQTPVIYYSTGRFTTGMIAPTLNSTIHPWSEVTSNTTLNAGEYYVAAYYPETDEYEAFLTQFKMLTVAKGTRPAPSAVVSVDGGKMTATLAEADRTKALEYAVDSKEASAWTLVKAENGVFPLGALSATSHTIYLRQQADENYLVTVASDGFTFSLTNKSVSYNANGGTGAPATQVSTSAITVSSVRPTRNGYTFDGWYTAATGGDAAAASYDSSITLYAHWTANSYTVKFNANGGTGTMTNQSFTYDAEATPLTANGFTAPTGKHFAGWATSANGAALYSDEQKVKNLTAEANGVVNLYAVWAENVYNVSITVKSEDTGNTVDLKLMRGNTVLKQEPSISIDSETKQSAEQSFNNIPAGTYNVVATQGTKTMTVAVILTNANHSATITMPTTNTNSTLTVAEDARPVVVDGLAAEAESKAQDDGSTTVTVAMSVTKQEEQELSATADEEARETQAAIESIKEELGEPSANQTREVEYMNIDLTKQVGSADPTKLTETTNVITVMIPYDMTGKSANGLKLFRYHNGEAQELTKLAEKPTTPADLTYCLLDNFIYLYTSQFSTYAISYTETTSSYSYSSGTTYAPTVSNSSNGTVSISPTAPKAGNKVTITAKPNEGYEVDAVTVTDAKGKTVAVTKNADGTYTFTQPSGKVKVDVTFKAASASDVLAQFTDVDTSSWYADAVRWAVENGVMNGVGDNRFSPNGDTTRAMVVTMLWRMENSPAVNYAMSFSDVESDTWYTEAVRWANAEGVVEGDGGKFNPNGAVTREQLATMLYRYTQYKKANVIASADLGSFNDAATVSGWATSAMQWAVGSGIINGMDGNLAPVNHATRAQVATMLMRYSTAK